MSGSIGVSMKPGQIALTRMPSVAKRTAIERVSPSTPAFDAAYAGLTPWATMPWIDAMPTTAASGALARSCGEERLHDHRVGAEVDLEQRIPGLVGEVGQVDRVGDARRVHEPADGADGRDGGVGRVGERVGLAHVDGHADGRHAVLGGDRLGGLGGAVLVEVPHRHRATHRRDRVRGGQPDPGGAPGDHDP